ncbi:cysteine--tRNA ligase [Candidatus Woesearchaeota archaeon]|nr:MAG: cysteine--tRNA ligase [Candidatus Woesearchaeota archaeon]
MGELRLFNTLGRKKEVFKPLHPPEVGMYCCGPTVYHYAHLGNLRAYVFEDVLRRVLAWNGFRVKHVMNITDVGHLTSDADEGEDKVEEGARREGKSVWEIAEFYTRAFKEDLQRLNVLEPVIWCKATDHIKEQLDMVLCLEKKGFTYKTSDGIYFDTSKVDDYGKLALLKKEDLLAGKRVAMGEKRNPTDFALWKFSPPGSKRQMEWDSPWGKSFPGWHIECSAMASKYLGEQFDIHCGGIDHIPVHHTNEIAQAEACFGKKPWVRFWLHNEFLVDKEGKMSKSKGDFLRLHTLLDRGFDPLAYRYLCLTTHYRKRLLFTWDAVASCQQSLDRLRKKVVEFKEEVRSGRGAGEGVVVPAYKRLFEEAVNDDLNTSGALAVVWKLLRDESIPARDRLATLFLFDSVLGLGLEAWEREEVRVPDEVKALLEERDAARKAKDWKLADSLREKIRRSGFEVVDTPQGQRVEKKKA